MIGLRATEYFSYVRKLLGFRAAVRFSVHYVLYKSRILRPKLYRMPVGPVNFYCKSIKQFAGLFMEIFLREYYYLEKTDVPMEMIDCGANIGVSLLYIKLMAPHARVKCFEPNPSALEILKKNIEANGWGRDVAVYPYALAKTNGVAEFYLDKDEEKNSGASLYKYLGKKSQLVSIHIQTACLSDYIDGPVDFLKMDIEGGEFDVLEELIAQDQMRNISRLQLEYHYHPEFFRKPLTAMLALLESAGFRTAVRATKEPRSVVGKDTAHAYMVYAWREKKKLTPQGE